MGQRHSVFHSKKLRCTFAQMPRSVKTAPAVLTDRTSCINATDSKCRRAIKPKAQELSTLSANARGDDILNRSRSACAEGTCVNASRELQSGKQTANAPSAFRVTATSSSSQGGREDERMDPSIRFAHLRRISREVKMRGCPLGG